MLSLSPTKVRHRRTLLAAAPLVLIIGGLLLPPPIQPQTSSPPTAAGATSITRPCTANPVLAPTSPKKGAQKQKHPLPQEARPTCLEAKGEGLEVQEFLQNTAREETWHIGENRTSEDTWFFVRYFDPEELEKYCDTKVSIEPVKFTSGKAAVTVQTTDLSDGFARVQVSAHFLAEGRSTDKAWAQPTSEWILSSKGVLESEIVTALQKRYKPMQ